MIFTLAQLVKDHLDEYVVTHHEEQEREREQVKAKQEAIENLKFVGDAVTAESYAQWRHKFDAERAVAKLSVSKLQNSKLTGRQLFERNKSMATSDLTQGDDGQVVEIDASAFANEVMSSSDDDDGEGDSDGQV